MRRLAFCTVMILLTASFAGLLAPAQEARTGIQRAGGDPPWPTYHGDEARTGNSTDSGPLTNHMLWSNSTGQYSYSSPAIANGKVYLPADDGSIYCFFADNGTRIWRTVLSSPAWSAPAVDVARDRVFVCDGTGLAFSTSRNIFCLNATTGAQVWRKTLPDYGESSPLVFGDTVIVGTGDSYVGGKNNSLYSFNITNGNQVWATPSAGSCASPALNEGRLYSVGNGFLRCMDPVTGAFLWNATVSHGYGSPSAADGRVFYPGANGQVYAFNASTGASLWQKSTGQGESSSTCAISSGYLYVSGDRNPFNGGGGVVVKMDVTDGTIGWTYSIAAPNGCWGAPVVSGEQVYFGYGSTVVCVNVTDKSVVWSYTGPAGTSSYGIGSSPSIAAGKLYIGGAEAKLYCFGPGEPNTPPAAAVLEHPSEIRETSAILRWSKSGETDFARYEVYRSTVSPVIAVPLNLAANITSSSLNWTNVTDLNYSAQYHFKVRVWDNGEPPMFNDSNEVEATTATPNGAPAAVVLYPPQDVSPFSMRLSWSTNADSDFVRYELHRGNSKGFTPSVSTLLQTIYQRDQNSTQVESLKPWTLYYFKVRVYDNGSPPLRADSNELEARTGNTPPAAAVLNPVQMGATSASLSWSVSSDEDFARYELHFSRNASFSPEEGTLAANLTGRQITDFTAEGLELARTYYFLVRTYDVGGLWNDSNIVSGTTMNTVPKPVISSPEDGDIYDTRTPVTFNGSGSTDQDRDPLSFYWSSGVSGLLSREEAFTALLPEGEHRITLYVSDGNGHNVSARISITVNRAPDRAPVMALAFPVDNSELAGIVNIHGTASDPDGNGTITMVEFSVDKAAWLEADGLTSWSYEWNTSNVANGKHKIAFRAFDGELYSPEVTVSFKVNNIVINLRPSVAITGPSVDKPLSGTVTVTGTASDPEGNLSRVEMSLNGGGWSPVTGASSWSYMLDTKTLRNGMHSVQVRAFDGVNHSDAAQLDFSVNNAGPTASSGPSNMLLYGVMAVVIVAVLAAVMVMRRRRPKGTPAQPPAAQPEAQPVAAQQYPPPQQQLAAEQYQPQTAMQSPAPGYPQPPPAYPVEYRPSGQEQYAPQEGYAPKPAEQAYQPQIPPPPSDPSYPPQYQQPPRQQ
jgi:outer membrane protein assembly factor BamB